MQSPFLISDVEAILESGVKDNNVFTKVRRTSRWVENMNRSRIILHLHNLMQL